MSEFKSGFRVNDKLAGRVGVDGIVSLHPSHDHRGFAYLVAGTSGRKWVASGYGTLEQAVEFCAEQGWTLHGERVAVRSEVYLPLDEGGKLTKRQAARQA